MIRKVETIYTFVRDFDRYEITNDENVRRDGVTCRPSDIEVGQSCEVHHDTKWVRALRVQTSDFTIRMHFEMAEFCGLASALLFAVGRAERIDGNMQFVEAIDHDAIQSAWPALYNKLLDMHAFADKHGGGGEQLVFATGTIWQHIYAYVKACGGDPASDGGIQKHEARQNLDRQLARDREDPNSVPHHGK